MSTKTVIQNTLNTLYNNNSSVCDISDVNSQDISFANMNFINCNVDFSNDYNSITLDSTIACLQSTSSSLPSQFTQLITNSLSSSPTTEDQLESQLGTNSVSDTATYITNNLDFTSISNCIETAINNQTIDISNISVYCTPASTAIPATATSPAIPAIPITTINFQNIANNLYSTVVMSCTNNIVDNFLNNLPSTQSSQPSSPSSPQPSSPSSSQPSSSQPSSPTISLISSITLTTPVIIGIVLGSVALLCIIIVLLRLFRKPTPAKVIQQFGRRIHRSYRI